MIQRIYAVLQAMSDTDILEMISARKFDEIKKTDPNPLFKVYNVGHEGISTAKILNNPALKQHWFRRSIQALISKLHEGIKFFMGHEENTNSHIGRQPIGELVGKGQKEENGILQAFAVAYIYPQYRDIDLNIASIETNLVMQKISETDAEICDIEDITGIALGNSAVDKPGFPGATLQGALQAFAGASGGSGGDNTMKTIEEVKAAIKEGKFILSQIFGIEEIKNDAAVIKHVKEEVQGEYKHRERTDKEFDRSRAEWNKEKVEYENKLKEASTATIKFKTGDVLDTLAKERKLDEKQLNFIKNRIGDFDTEATDESAIKKDLDAHISKELPEFDRTYKEMTGKDYKAAAEGEETGKVTPGTPGSDEETLSGKEDLLDPEKNDFIAE